MAKIPSGRISRASLFIFLKAQVRTYLRLQRKGLLRMLNF
jgi:hypothetical protein